jgi:hypothetical protein
LKTLQNVGVQGRLSSTLHGACENGVASIWRRRPASAALVPINMPIRQMAKSRSMGRNLERVSLNLIPALVGIKPDSVHIRARSFLHQPSSPAKAGDPVFQSRQR